MPSPLQSKPASAPVPPHALPSAWSGLWFCSSPALSQTLSMESVSSHSMPESVMAMRMLSSPVVSRQARSIDMPEAVSCGRTLTAALGMNPYRFHCPEVVEDQPYPGSLGQLAGSAMSLAVAVGGGGQPAAAWPGSSGLAATPMSTTVERRVIRVKLRMDGGLLDPGQAGPSTKGGPSTYHRPGEPSKPVASMSASPFADLQRLPRVDRVAAHPSLDAVRRRLGAEAMTHLARRAIDEARQAVRGGAPCPALDDVAARAAALAGEALAARARPVINATGVVLHTNLGRAPLAGPAVEALAASAGRYTSIEIDLGTGRRGARAAFAEGGLARLAGAEAALVVNNNAAATLLALSALALGRKVIVSRGELIEIGGGFRVPDVCARSGAELVEVGTTNRTRLADYEQAFAAHAGVAAILRVHPGNFRQVGFVERPPAAALAELAHARGALLIEDLGGGAMIDLAPHGLEGEPTVRATVAAGADVVCFSTDKVLGGPQGGALVGRAAVVELARRDPLARALRLGRLPLVALEATVALYLEGRLDEIPALAALRRPVAAVRARAEAWHAALTARGVPATVVDLEGAVGGGALAEAPLASAGVALEGDAEALAARLRAGDPPVVGRIQQGRLLLDARTVLPGEDEALLAAVAAAMG